jgi:transcriptional regulator with XRE-family HTH domain
MATRDEDLVALGAQIGAARLERGLSRRQAANEAELSLTTWSNLEDASSTRGGERVRHRATPEVIIRACGVVGLDKAAALTLAGYDPAGYNMADSGRPTASGREIADRVSQLPREQREVVSDMIDALLASPAAPPAPRHGSAPTSARVTPAQPARGPATMHPGHDETGRDPVVPESRPAESRI